ncbi:MAG: 30S ribosomal protein S17 [Acidobacteria bacterium]|nr:30S ribosomal protein S17 [Acidobacteriota bacterium]
MAAKTEVTGTVVRDKMLKSRVVAVERQVRHEMYGKAQRLTSTFMAHDEQNETRNGDVVAMVESRPLSARKRWVITRVVKRAAQAGAAAE